MTQQKGGVSGTRFNETTICNGSPDACAPGDSGRVALPDMLTYMADMISELRSIAEKNNWQTLSGLLALSHAEAMTRRDDISMRRAGPSHDR